VRIVVADSSPIHYLVLIGHSEVLPVLFERVIIPVAVRDELVRTGAPETVRRWAQAPPPWLEIHPPTGAPLDHSLENLDEGERAALELAASIGADLVLLDDREGARAARTKGLRVIGTLRVLQLGAHRRLLNLDDAFERIKRTNFRYRQGIMDELLSEQPRQEPQPSRDRE
jgi:predicted nucleic acid-binding protein